MLPNRPGLALRRAPVEFFRRLAVIAAGVGLVHTGVGGKSLALHEAHRHRSPNHAFEDVAQDIAIPEATQAVERERRVMRDLVVEVELAEPAVREVQLNFLSEPALRQNAIAIADDEAPDRLLGINGRPADIAVEGLQP